MLNVTLCLLAVLVILVLSDSLWKKKLLRQELHRKFVHITVGVFVAFWPWLVSWRQIQLMGLAMAAGVTIDRYYKVFKIDHRINRQTYGDLFFALAISLSALLTTNKIFFMIGILHIALADGLAALIGRKYGKRWKYKVFGETRTVVGTMAFWTTSMLILAIGLMFVLQPDIYVYALAILLLPPVLSFLENISILGLDNLVISTAVIVALNNIY